MIRLAAGGTVLAVVLLLTFGSVIALLVVAGGAGRLGPADWAAIRFTLTQSLLSATLSAFLAVPFARALMRRDFAGRRALVGFLGAPFLLPVIVAILGLLSIWGRGGVVNDGLAAIGVARIDIFGMPGVVMAHVFFNLPLVTRLLLQGWQAIPSERFRLAAQLGMSPRDVFRLIELPMLRATLPGAFLLVFLLCMTSFAVALALGGGPRATTIELAIYQALRFEFELGRAALLALVQFCLCLALALVALAVGAPAGFGAGLLGSTTRWDAPRGWYRWGDSAIVLLSTIFVASPILFVLLRGAGSLGYAITPGLTAAAGTSLFIAIGSALLAVMAALSLGLLIVAIPRRSGILVEGLGLLMLAGSPFVIGTGLFILIQPVADPFAWALWVTAAINAAMSLPFALRVLVPPLAEIAGNHGRLADSLGVVGVDRLRLLILPLLSRPLGFAMGLSAALSMGDLGVITLFAPPGVETLPLHMYRLMGAYRMDDAAAAALVLLTLSLLLFSIFDRGGRLGDPF